MAAFKYPMNLKDTLVRAKLDNSLPNSCLKHVQMPDETDETDAITALT